MTSSRLADAVAARYSGWWHLSAASSTFPTRSLKHVREHSHELMPSPLRAAGERVLQRGSVSAYLLTSTTETQSIVTFAKLSVASWQDRPSTQLTFASLQPYLTRTQGFATIYKLIKRNAMTCMGKKGTGENFGPTTTPTDASSAASASVPCPSERGRQRLPAANYTLAAVSPRPPSAAIQLLSHPTEALHRPMLYKTGPSH
ncbi:hypothetical protein A1Q1_07794 [Trichosporon asahii var. asahii CBS 2479]|uniref:Uncharacterized protein n=1 Tax=Trichosporon asahii var. asahii (strain ATCC 90039 / CBS 2479 / JCM 2466 / KCTC 7840 / NBRC 103889/ NCYC 2677 / UAMH 7654) TaxID=1186058 RepID=J4UHH4_TRIAS|nr:hypothetical protein A1Q1_07794 [Trichosporon asahii var. asahii CBS 2479]EJT51000.1 hypothetical protein A1Q1_07794 [Trichosporon asahii var. asahii CBS 2479]